jgi:hypothetical protein
MGKTRIEDPVMQAVQKRFEESKLTLQALGEKMGYPAPLARQSAWQFIHAGDPQISSLRKFAEAMGIGLATMLKG